jgi:hypothetical protein
LEGRARDSISAGLSLDAIREVQSQLSTDIRIECMCNQDPAANDRIMAALPEASVVINSTGMGKDTPSSPKCTVQRSTRSLARCFARYRKGKG